MVILDWSREGWRAFRELPLSVRQNPDHVFSQDITIPAGAVAFLEREENQIVHGYIRIDMDLEDFIAKQGTQS